MINFENDKAYQNSKPYEQFLRYFYEIKSFNDFIITLFAIDNDKDTLERLQLFVPLFIQTSQVPHSEMISQISQGLTIEDSIQIIDCIKLESKAHERIVRKSC